MSYFLINVLIILCLFSSSYPQIAPAGVTSAILVKILSFEKNVNSSGEINIYIMGAPDVAAELKKITGKKAGDLTIKTVEASDKLPSVKPSIVFNDNPAFAESVSKYTKTNKIMSMTRNKDIPKDGTTIFIELTADGKPLILINAEASNSQALEWNPAVFKIAKKLE